ncbi:Cys-tRNA(Pro) deacylase [Kocuria soli]|uniref:Cys-tRNA(Pro)/Cys-tRNA(Cys) deacylase n=1 Tax=Kocuria soli TaxID=2485125 RepID=A0A3N3ZY39_9MICC|nr:Cys-tRNA(Pro) deacylase [Kocuria soli]ROZ63689.1 Cys-tRNA(Pro) deacylase [Kocuria soli]
MGKKSKHGNGSTASEATPALRFLHDRGVAFQEAAYEHDDDVTDYGAEAAQALGVSAERVFKTLLVAEADGKALGVVVLPVDHRVAMKAAAAAFGWKKAVLADPAVAQRRTGYVIGGISPFGQKLPSPTVIDESAMHHATVYVSGGRRGLDVEVTPQDLVSVLNAKTAALSA